MPGRTWPRTTVSASVTASAPSPGVIFVTPFSLAPGTYGLALVGDNFTTGITMAHSYTNGTGTNQNTVSADGVITLDLGSATNAAFTGAPFTPRVWNGEICSSGPIAPGANYCTANVNSTGVGAAMSASGTNSCSANDLVLEASDLPVNSFGFFLTSQTQGFVANPGGSQGNLCLGGAIGRYVGTGQIQNSGSTGSIALAIDNTQVPQPTGLVAVRPARPGTSRPGTATRWAARRRATSPTATRSPSTDRRTRRTHVAAANKRAPRRAICSTGGALLRRSPGPDAQVAAPARDLR